MRTVRLPICVNEQGSLVRRDGLPLPELKGLIEGELLLPEEAIVDQEFLAELLGERAVEIVPAGQTLWAEVRPNGAAAEHPAAETHVTSVGSRVQGVAIELLCPLKLTLRGTKKPRLVNCRCGVPALKKEFDSVNEAYTVISEAYETKRRSHAGNVFACVFTKSDRGVLSPLDNLRKKALGISF